MVMPLESYLRTLWDFLQAKHHGRMGSMPYEENTQVSYLRLSASGSWEVMAMPPDMLASRTMADLVIPLVLPLVPIILVAHVEIQWARSQSEAGVIALRSSF
jgi:hypothetical protein